MAAKLLAAREVAAIMTDGRHSIGGGLHFEVVGKARRWFEPRRFRRRFGASSQAAMDACSCSSRQRRSASAGGMLPIGSRSRRES